MKDPAAPARDLLAGNGVGLLRERALAAAIQGGLERLYQLDRVADVGPFLTPAAEGERESLSVHVAEDGVVEMSLRLPHLGPTELDVLSGGDLDPLCQIIEGVSHFVTLAARAHEDRTTTQLELELQAEVDKYIVLLAALGARGERESARVRARLYDDVAFTSDSGTEIGDRYRMANQVAARYTQHLERRFVVGGRVGELHRELRRFFRLGLDDKLRIAA